MMGKALRWLAFLVIAGAVGKGLYYEYQNNLPCTHPIMYSIGAVDPRFGISDSALLADIKAAAAIWNKAEGKTLLAYDPNAALKINLIYDEREANAKLGNQIAVAQENADAARATLEALHAQFAAREAAYNQEVDAINARGGATRAEANSLASERDALNAFSDSINRQVADFNSRIADLNATIREFNQTAGRPFEEGLYLRDASGERINIFEFVGLRQLERVLAHELGHAIGLGHNDDPKSIMFAQNESGNLTPTASDLAALRAVCGS